MLEPKTLSDLSKAFQAQPHGFVITDSGRPRFAVLDYETYKKLAAKQNRPPRRKILVTGGAGYIGAITARLLQQRGYEVVVFDNLSTGRREAVVGCELIVGDLLDKTALENLFARHKFDAVIHFAALIEVEESMADPARYFQNNVVGGLNLLDAMVEAGVPEIIFSSSATVYAEPEHLPIREGNPCAPQNPYGESKYIFERILKSYSEIYGLRAVSLRYFNAAGAWPEEGLGFRLDDNTLLVPRVLNVARGRAPEIEVFGQDYPTTDGTCIRDYVHVLDLAEAHLAALEKLMENPGYKVYNVGTGRGHSVLEVIDQAVEITGRMIPMKVAPRRSGDLTQSVADSSAFQSATSWRPKHDLQSIIESAWQWHQNQTK